MSEPKLIIVVNKALNMRKGKIGAQCGHAAEYFMFERFKWEGRRATADFTQVEVEWMTFAHAKVVVSAKDEAELRDLIAQAKRDGVAVHEVIDAGRTEFHGVPTLTCCAFGPDYPEKIDPITGHLPLL